MSRHRDVRKLDYDEEYNQAYDEDVYGHSVDDGDYGVSPGMEEYIYNRSRDNTQGFGLYFPTGEDIKEEEEAVNGTARKSESLQRSRHDSSSYVKPLLSPEDEVRLASILDELRNILGDKYSEGELTETVLTHKFELDASLNALLNKTSSPATAQSLPQREKRVRSRDKPFTASDGVKQLTLSHNHHRDYKGESAQSCKAPSSEASKLPRQPAAPIVVTTPAKGGSTPRVVRGFNVHDAEESGAAENNLGSQERESKRSRSNTPVRGWKDKDKERDKDTPTVTKTPAKIRDKAVDVLTEYKEQRGSGKDLLNLVVVGHVDAGKSTLMGHLLYLQGNVGQRTMHKYEQESKKVGKQSFMYAWVLDDTDEERSRGITVDIAQRMFESESKIITLLDAPGHRDFIPNMITGAARADVAVLVVDASKGGFEAGFESGGQTREHAILIRSLGVSQLAVSINKLDSVEWSEERFKNIKHNLRQFLKTVGFKDADVVYIPCSGLTGENLVKPSTEERLCSWYKGPTLLQAIDQLKLPERGISRPVRMCVNDVYKGQGSNMCVSGRLDTGYVQNSDRLLLLPQGDVITVKISGVDPSVLHIGDFLCDPTHPIPLVTRVQARIVVFNITVPVIKGAQVDFHYQAVTEPAKIRKLVSHLHKTTGQIVKNKPRALVKNTAAIVELEFTRPLCLELFRDFKELGRFMLRTGGSTVAAGLVTQILE
ncbi:HBS1-like protein-like [Homarus americanus]|uniref:HBS1-like protein-like n=1 Tax=Homarus americanus TaxID=6706 RepID=A0A8J5JVJ3_HOMAM|nr:HBS1-like protein-like [Homarus americanus]